MFFKDFRLSKDYTLREKIYLVVILIQLCCLTAVTNSFHLNKKYSNIYSSDVYEYTPFTSLNKEYKNCLSG